MGYLSRVSSHYKKGGLDSVIVSVKDTIRNNVVQTSKEWGGSNVSDFYTDSIVRLPGYDLKVDPEDGGISHELMNSGIREPAAYWNYRRVISQMDSPIVFEAGANLGYYALAAATDAPDAHVICAELDDNNVKMLNKNVKMNGLEEQFSVSQAALDEKSRSVERTIDENSNCHRIHPTDDSTPTETVQTINAGEFIQNQGFEQHDIDVVRMDVEGSEVRILRGAPDLEPEAAHIEVHLPILTSSEWDDLIDIFENWPCDLIGSYKGNREFDVDTIHDIPVNKSVELVFG